MIPSIFKIIATSGFLTALEWTHSFSAGDRWGQPWEAYTALPRTLAGLRSRPTSNGEGWEEKEKKEEEGKGEITLRKFLDPPLWTEYSTTSPMGGP